MELQNQINALTDEDLLNPSAKLSFVSSPSGLGQPNAAQPRLTSPYAAPDVGMHVNMVAPRSLNRNMMSIGEDTLLQVDAAGLMQTGTSSFSMNRGEAGDMNGGMQQVRVQ